MVVSRGKYRSIKLETLSNENTRPTLGKVKEAIFSMLGNNIYDAIVLDLFAGSGSLGIEALSCDAKWVDFYDVSYDAISVIKNNVAKIDSNSYSITKLNYKVVLEKAKKDIKKYDIIFLDPPYNLNIINELVMSIYDNDILSDKGVIICEYSIDEEVFDHYKEFVKYKDKKYGKTKISMFRRR